MRSTYILSQFRHLFLHVSLGFEVIGWNKAQCLGHVIYDVSQFALLCIKQIGFIGNTPNKCNVCVSGKILSLVLSNPKFI